jgi:hypothetical protein
MKENGAFGGMKIIGRRNRSTRRKPAKRFVPPKR